MKRALLVITGTALGLVTLLTLLAPFARSARAFELATHFPVQYALVAAIAGTVFAARRTWWASAVALACITANAFVVMPYLASAVPTAAAGPHDARIRVMLSNVYYRNRDASALLAAVRAEQPDVLILEELTPDWWQRVAPLKAEYPYFNAWPLKGGSGVALFSRLPLDSTSIVADYGTYMPGVTARVLTDEGPVTIIGLHPPTPTRDDKLVIRNAQFSRAAERARASGGPVIIIGDLNTTPYSPYFQDLLRDSGLRDARVGAGILPTWPIPMPSLLRIPIDHCLVSPDIRVISLRSGPSIGSDHLPLVVDLAVPESIGQRRAPLE